MGLRHVVPCLVLAVAFAVPATRAQLTTRVSVDSAGIEGNGFSYWGVPSVDGRFVAFAASASNLVPNDTNGCQDVFLRDRVAGTTERVSVDSAGAQQTGDIFPGYALPTVSGDGRYVIFASFAADLVPGDTNGMMDVFVRDRLLSSTTRISVDASGNQGLAGDSAYPLSSVDGRYVAFASDATNLVPGDTNGKTDIYVKDLWTGAVDRASLAAGGGQPALDCRINWISDNGRFVVFETLDGTLVPGDGNGKSDVFLRDRATGTTELASRTSVGGIPTGSSFSGAVSAEGRYVFFTSNAADVVPGDTNGRWDVFMRDRTLGTTIRVSLGTGGVEAVDHDSYLSAISSDGRFLLFWSLASNLVPGDTNASEDIFLRDRITGAIQRMNVDTAGNEANAPSYIEYSSLTADGQAAVFQSYSTNLVGGDANGAFDIFVRELQSPWSNSGSALAGLHGDPILYATGTVVAGEPFALRLINARPSSLAMLFASLGVGAGAPFKGGVLKTVPILMSIPVATNPGGEFVLTALWPALPSGTQVGFQYAIQDAAAIYGVSLSNCLKATVP